VKTSNSNTSPAVYFPIVGNGIHGLDQCCVCGKVGQFGDFSMSTFSGKSYCEAHERELMADVRAGEKAAKK
jgi:hypothetical protein